MLYEVYAIEQPGADEQHIANLFIRSQLTTSLWGDEKMYFRHHRPDDDFRFKPEWMSATPDIRYEFETE